MSDEDGGGTEEPEDGVPRDPGQLLVGGEDGAGEGGDEAKAGDPAKKKQADLRAVCGICGAPAADHLHYGAFCCYSCRAFFRRSGHRVYKCVRTDDTCAILMNNRRNCKKCRYRKCLEAGMKPALVDKHLRERERKKLETLMDAERAQPMDADGPQPMDNDGVQPMDCSRSEPRPSKDANLPIDCSHKRRLSSDTEITAGDPGSPTSQTRPKQSKTKKPKTAASGVKIAGSSGKNPGIGRKTAGSGVKTASSGSKAKQSQPKGGSVATGHDLSLDGHDRSSSGHHSPRLEVKNEPRDPSYTHPLHENIYKRSISYPSNPSSSYPSNYTSRSPTSSYPSNPYSRSPAKSPASYNSALHWPSHNSEQTNHPKIIRRDSVESYSRGPSVPSPSHGPSVRSPSQWPSAPSPSSGSSCIKFHSSATNQIMSVDMTATSSLGMTASSTGRSSAGMTDRSSSGMAPTSSLGVTTTFTSAEMSLRNESNNHSQYFQQRSPGFLSDPTAAAAMHNNSGPSSSELLAASRKSPYQSHHFPRYQDEEASPVRRPQEAPAARSQQGAPPAIRPQHRGSAYVVAASRDLPAHLAASRELPTHQAEERQRREEKEEMFTMDLQNQHAVFRSRKLAEANQLAAEVHFAAAARLEQHMYATRQQYIFQQHKNLAKHYSSAGPEPQADSGGDEHVANSKSTRYASYQRYLSADRPMGPSEPANQPSHRLNLPNMLRPSQHGVQAQSHNLFTAPSLVHQRYSSRLKSLPQDMSGGDHQRTTGNHQQSTGDHQRTSVDPQQPTMDNQRPIGDHQLSGVDHQRHTGEHQRPTGHHSSLPQQLTNPLMLWQHQRQQQRRQQHQSQMPRLEWNRDEWGMPKGHTAAAALKNCCGLNEPDRFESFTVKLEQEDGELEPADARVSPTIARISPTLKDEAASPPTDSSSVDYRIEAYKQNSPVERAIPFSPEDGGMSTCKPISTFKQNLPGEISTYKHDSPLEGTISGNRQNFSVKGTVSPLYQNSPLERVISPYNLEGVNSPFKQNSPMEKAISCYGQNSTVEKAISSLSQNSPLGVVNLSFNQNPPLNVEISPFNQNSPVEKASSPSNKNSPTEKAISPCSQNSTAEKAISPSNKNSPVEMAILPINQNSSVEKAISPFSQNSPKEKAISPYSQNSAMEMCAVSPYSDRSTSPFGEHTDAMNFWLQKKNNVARNQDTVLLEDGEVFTLMEEIEKVLSSNYSGKDVNNKKKVFQEYFYSEKMGSNYLTRDPVMKLTITERDFIDSKIRAWEQMICLVMKRNSEAGVDQKYSEPGGVMEEARSSADAVANNEVKDESSMNLIETIQRQGVLQQRINCSSLLAISVRMFGGAEHQFFPDDQVIKSEFYSKYSYLLRSPWAASIEDEREVLDTMKETAKLLAADRALEVVFTNCLMAGFGYAGMCACHSKDEVLFTNCLMVGFNTCPSLEKFFNCLGASEETLPRNQSLLLFRYLKLKVGGSSGRLVFSQLENLVGKLEQAAQIFFNHRLML